MLHSIVLLLPLLLTNSWSLVLNDSSRVCAAGQRPSVSSYLAQRSLGNLGQLNLIPDIEPGAADSGVTHPAESGTLRRE